MDLLTPNPNNMDAAVLAAIDDIKKQYLAPPPKPKVAAHLLYRSQHKPTIETVNDAVQFSAGDFDKYNILINGPSGTGKELIAQIIAGNRKLNAINLAGLTDTLFESQLFGYVPGAFTGGLARGYNGFLRDAEGGVAFLDEIGELPLSQQAKLLRVIEKREVLPVGSSERVPLKCRFVFATNRDLLKMVDAGTFREDLYFRISHFILQTYSLFDRGQDEIQYIAREIQKANGWSELPPGYVIPIGIVAKGNVRALTNWLLNVEYDRAPECADIEQLEKGIVP